MHTLRTKDLYVFTSWPALSLVLCPFNFLAQASPVDWLADVSYRLIIYDLAALILRNTASGVVTQLDQAPVGKALVVCDPLLPGEGGEPTL
jgi:hypothetical protein